MKKSLLLLLITAGLVLAGIFYRKNPPSPPPSLPTASESGFAQDLKKAASEAAKKAKAAEEKKFLAAYGPCRQLPILMYHHVGNLPAGRQVNSNWLYVRPETFASQMDYLIGKGYTVITLPEVVVGLNGSSLPAKPVAITFDDGYRDFFDSAWPILRAKNLKATVFIITQLMGGSDYLTWEQAREIVYGGLVSFGSHTLDHRSLTRMNEDELRNEIFAPKAIIETNLGRTINVFAYPFGNTNSRATPLLVESGFAAAVTASRGWACAKLPFGLPRIRIGNNSLASYGL